MWVEVDIWGRGVVLVEVGVLGVLGELEADTCDVCDSLGPLLKGPKSQEGASFAKVPRAGEFRRALADVAEMVDRNECIEDCDGEALSLLNDGVATVLGESSLGRSTITRLGLSSIGWIFVVMTEFRCESRLSFRIAIPPSDVMELRLGFGS